MATLEGIESELVHQSELFETDQPSLMEFAGKYDRETLITVCDGIEWGPIVEEWNDNTLRRVRESGTNIAFTRDIARRVSAAVNKEYAKRNVGTAPAANGMQEDGGQ